MGMGWTIWIIICEGLVSVPLWLWMLGGSLCGLLAGLGVRTWLIP